MKLTKQQQRTAKAFYASRKCIDNLRKQLQEELIDPDLLLPISKVIYSRYVAYFTQLSVAEVYKSVRDREIVSVPPSKKHFTKRQRQILTRLLQNFASVLELRLKIVNLPFVFFLERKDLLLAIQAYAKAYQVSLPAAKDIITEVMTPLTEETALEIKREHCKGCEYCQTDRWCETIERLRIHERRIFELPHGEERHLLTLRFKLHVDYYGD